MRLFVRAFIRASVYSSYYILDRRTAPSDRTAPKFGTHVRIVSLTLKKKFDPPHPEGVVVWVAAVYVSLTYFGTRPSDRAQIWLACADRYCHLKKKLTHPTPGGGFRGSYIVKNLSRRIASKFGTHVRIDTLTLKKIKMLTHPTPGGFRGLYIVKNLSRRIAPKFGTHVRIDTHLKKKKNLTHPTPGGFRGLYIVTKSFATDRAQIWHACADRYSHLKKYIKKLTHPTPGGFRGLNCLARLALARERTPSLHK